MTALALGPCGCVMESGTAQMELMRGLATALCLLCLHPLPAPGRALLPALWLQHQALWAVPALVSLWE